MWWCDTWTSVRKRDTDFNFIAFMCYLSPENSPWSNVALSFFSLMHLHIHISTMKRTLYFYYFSHWCSQRLPCRNWQHQTKRNHWFQSQPTRTSVSWGFKWCKMLCVKGLLNGHLGYPQSKFQISNYIYLIGNWDFFLA
jgi:hypothetical protein